MHVDRLDDANIIYALNWPCRIFNNDVQYGESGSCSSAGKVKRGEAQPPRACIPGCDKDEADDATWTFNRSVLEALYAPALAFRSKHHVPLWIDQLMCPPEAFRNADAWLADSMDVIGFDDTHFSWWTWKARMSGDTTQAVLASPPSTNKADATLYQVFQPGYNLFRQSFENVKPTQLARSTVAV